MFSHVTAPLTLRSPAVLTALANVDLGRVPYPDAGGHVFVITTAALTVGTVAVGVFGSNDGTTYADLGDQFDITIAASGERYVFPTGTLPPYLRVALTPAGGFDGTIGVVYRCSQGPLS